MKKFAQFKCFSPVQTVNMLPMTLLTAFVLEQMTARGRGIIVNISSMVGYSPFYYWAVYAATKVLRNTTAAEYPSFNLLFCRLT